MNLFSQVGIPTRMKKLLPTVALLLQIVNGSTLEEEWLHEQIQSYVTTQYKPTQVRWLCVALGKNTYLTVYG